MGRINWAKHGHTYSRRELHVLYLTGALHRAEGHYGAPVNPIGRREYDYGQECVDRGLIVINDPQAMRAFIADVREGRFP